MIAFVQEGTAINLVKNQPPQPPHVHQRPLTGHAAHVDIASSAVGTMAVPRLTAGRRRNVGIPITINIEPAAVGKTHVIYAESLVECLPVGSGNIGYRLYCAGGSEMVVILRSPTRRTVVLGGTANFDVVA